jgi:ABC-type branched-subunit amino acid transport system ATPase component/branched-subunit amino acid ABC-type transport system permease component
MTEFFEFLLLGIGTGGAYALLAVGATLIYRGSGVVNFAQGAMALFALSIFYEIRSGVGTIAALIIAVASTAALGAIIEIVVMRPMKSSSPLVKVIATLAVLTAIQEAATLKFGEIPIYVVGIFPSRSLHPFTGIFFGEEQLDMFLVTLLLTAVLWVAYKYSRFGIATTAMSENSRATASLGWSPNFVSTANWALGGALAGLAGCLLGPIAGLSPSTLTLAVIPALAACLIGGFSSYPLTMIGGILIGVLESETTFYIHTPGWSAAVPFIVIIAVLVIRGRPLPLRGDRTARLPGLGTGAVNVKAVGIGIVVVVLSLVFFSANWSTAMITAGAYGILCLSLVVVTGYCGQLSLAQFALAGLGALIAGRLSDVTGMPSLVAMIFGVLLTIPLGVIVALPAVRVRGANLAIVTLGMAVVISDVILANPSFTGGVLVGTVISPPTLFGWNLLSSTYPARYAGFVIALLILSALLVAKIRRGKSGRKMIAVRNNERAAASLGVSVTKAKLYAFGVGAGLAALGGILLAFENVNIIYSNFDPFGSITVILQTVVGSVGYVSGGLVGGAAASGGPFEELITHWVNAGDWYLFIGALLTIFVLVRMPDGVAADNIRQWRYLRSKFQRKPREAKEVAVVVPAFTPLLITPASLEIRDVSVNFGGVKALDGVSLTVEPGKVVGLIGPNGAGKTTLIDAITGFHRHYKGSILVDGKPIDRMGPNRRAKVGLVRSFQSLELFDDLSILDNLRVAAEGAASSETIGAVVQEFELERVLNSYPSELNYAQRRLVAIARAVAAGPSLLMLDEPAAGLDEPSANELSTIVRRLASELGLGILLIEHDISLVMRTCDWIEVLDFGKKLASGTPAAVRNDAKVIEAYLGVESV